MLPSLQAESIPQLTSAGPIDAAADLAVLAETLFERRQSSPTYPLSFLEEEAVAEASAQKMDSVLEDIHARNLELSGPEVTHMENRQVISGV
jgi:hypothetical protein